MKFNRDFSLLLILLIIPLLGCEQHQPRSSAKVITNNTQLDKVDTSKKASLYNEEWISLDATNYTNLLLTLSNHDLLQNSNKFIKSLKNFDIRDKKDLGFGLTYLECVQYGGYISVWTKLFVFEDEIVYYSFDISEHDQPIIEYIINNGALIKNKISEDRISNPFSFLYSNGNSIEKYKAIVAKKLGDIKNVDTSNKELASNFDVLVSPFYTYEYGSHCGVGGSDPTGREAINYFVSNNDAGTLRKIIKGYNPEGRLYAIEALLSLASNGKTELTNEDKKIINSVLSLKIQLSTCSGCMYGKSDARSLLSPKYERLLRK